MATNNTTIGDRYYNSGDYSKAKECYQSARDGASEKNVVLQLDTNIISCTIREALKKKDTFLKTIGAVKLSELNGQCQEIASKIDTLVLERKQKEKLQTQNNQNSFSIQNAIAANSFNDALKRIKKVDWNDAEACKIIVELLKTAETLYRGNNLIDEADETLKWIGKILENRGDALMDQNEYRLAFDSYQNALNISLQLKASTKRQRALFLSLFNAFENCKERRDAAYAMYKKLSMDALEKKATPEEMVELAYAAYQLEQGKESLDWANQVMIRGRKCQNADVYQSEIGKCQFALIRPSYMQACQTFVDDAHFDRSKALVVLRTLSMFHSDWIKREKTSILMVRMVSTLAQGIKKLNLSESKDEGSKVGESDSAKEIYKNIIENYIDLLGSFFPKNSKRAGETLENLFLEIGKVFLPANLLESDPQAVAHFLAVDAPTSSKAALLLRAIEPQNYWGPTLKEFSTSDDLTLEKTQEIFRAIGENSPSGLKVYFETAASSLEENNQETQQCRDYFKSVIEGYLELLKEHTPNDFHQNSLEVMRSINAKLDKPSEPAKKRRKIDEETAIVTS